MFGRQPLIPIEFELGLPIDVLGDNCNKTRYVCKLKQRLNCAYKRAREMSQKQAQEYKLSYDSKLRGAQLQIDDLVLVKIVALKGRYKIQNKWEPDRICSFMSNQIKVFQCTELNLLGNGKERVFHRNMLLPLGIKFFPENDSDIDSDQEEEPELQQCQVERANF